MELEFLAAESFIRPPKVVRPTFTVTKGSLLRLNKPLVALLGLQPGDKLAIGQDKKQKDDWYIGKADTGFALKATSPPNSHMTIQLSGLASRMREAFAKCEPPIQIPVAMEGQTVNGLTLHALITRAIK